MWNRLKPWVTQNAPLIVGMLAYTMSFTLEWYALPQVWLSSSGDALMVYVLAICLPVVPGYIVFTTVKGWQKVALQETKITVIEKKVEESPKAPQFAWQLAQAKLEQYVDRNLSQSWWIFGLTVLVMLAGFSLIVNGAHQAFQKASNLNASVLSSVSGIVVSFIGGTFLIIFKATMAQTKDYVAMPERINAVGMSIQVVELLDEADGQLKHQTIASIATQLLGMYAGVTPRSSGSSAAQDPAPPTH